MGVEVGDVFVGPGRRRDFSWVFVTAKVEDEEAWLVPMRWFRQEPPPPSELDGLEPIAITWMVHASGPHHLAYRALRRHFPPALRRIGTRHAPRPIDVESEAAGDFDLETVVYRCERQYLWETQLADQERSTYEAAKPYGWRSAGDGEGEQPLASLEGKCVDALHHVGGDLELQAYAEQNRLLFELHLTRSTLEKLDLRRTNVTKVRVAGSRKLSLFLPTFAEELWVQGPFGGLEVHHERNGKGLKLNLEDVKGEALPDLGLPDLMALDARGADRIDATQVVAHYPKLRALTLFGAPGTLVNVEALAELGDLRKLFIRDLFGDFADAFPAPDRWPVLESLTLVSVPEELGQRVRRGFAQLRYLDVTKLRKPTWLELNLDNPFRDWDGRESIRPAVAKGAFKAYLEAKKKIVEASAAGSSPAEAEQAIEAFILRLNRLATKSPLETMERDEVMHAVRALGERGGVPTRRVEELFETLEDF